MPSSMFGEIDITRSINQANRSYIRKILFLIWSLAGSVFIGFMFLGFFRKDFIGYILTGFLLVAALLNISICISYSLYGLYFRIAKVAWSLLSIAIVVFIFILLGLRPNNTYEGAEALIGFPMLVLSFPAGFVFIYAYAGFHYFIGQINLFIDMFIFWCGLFGVGYFQWFKLLPYLIKVITNLQWIKRKTFKKA